jgi:hypothetical protein
MPTDATQTPGFALPADLNISTHAALHDAFRCMFNDKAMVTEELVDLAYGLHLDRGDGPAICLRWSGRRNSRRRCSTSSDPRSYARRARLCSRAPTPNVHGAILSA